MTDVRVSVKHFEASSDLDAYDSMDKTIVIRPKSQNVGETLLSTESVQEQSNLAIKDKLLFVKNYDEQLKEHHFIEQSNSESRYQVVYPPNQTAEFSAETKWTGMMSDGSMGKPPTSEVSRVSWNVRKAEGTTYAVERGQIDLSIKGFHPGKFACAQCCSRCARGIRLPSWLTKGLLLTYTNIGGLITYGLLLLFIYTTCFALKPSVAVPPICRQIAVPEIKRNPDLNRTEKVSVPNVNFQLPPGYKVGLECKKGEAMSVLIFYGFSFLIGEMMEFLHLPGLLGMLLGGLALRNIGIILLPQTIYHEVNLPNGSYPLRQANASQLDGDDSLFDIRDPLTQLAALLLVNPSLSGVLRQLALATILTRAGLGLDPTTLKQVFWSVFRLAFLPCICEAVCLMIVTRMLIGWPWVWGAILGFVCAAVSPAVIVPNMMRLEVTGWGVAQGVPTLVVAAASLDDVIAITGFGVALGVALSTDESLVTTLIWGPAEALIGITFGAAVGVVVCVFPPPKLEHSHLLRGIILICLAVTGLLGSIALKLPGAGALACLTLAFTVATGWRAGFPWRFVQTEEQSTAEYMAAIDKNPETTTEDRGQINRPPKYGGDFSEEKDDNGEHSRISKITNPDRLSAEIDNTDRPCEQTFDESELGGQSLHASRLSNKGSGGSNILEALVEYHPYYYSILKQQYQSSQGKESARRNISRISLSKRFLKALPSGDLPALAVAVAATGGERKGPNKSVTPHNVKRNRQKNFRRFSLPEPTAHYELESFSVSGSSRRIQSPSPVGSTARSSSRALRRMVSPTFREQYEAKYNQPEDKLEEVEENDHEHLEYTETSDQYQEAEKENILTTGESMNRSGSSTASVISLPATPQERGLACVNSMRQTLAAVWWFVQPILFSLIGSEVNLTHMAGQSTGLGVLSLLIALVIRLGATILSVLPSPLNMKERLFVGFSWLPKATVQAAVGPVALDTARKLNASTDVLEYGQQILTLAALAILLTAPLGAILMPLTAPYLLRQDPQALLTRTEYTLHLSSKFNTGSAKGTHSSPPPVLERKENMHLPATTPDPKEENSKHK